MYKHSLYKDIFVVYLFNVSKKRTLNSKSTLLLMFSHQPLFFFCFFLFFFFFFSRPSPALTLTRAPDPDPAVVHTLRRNRVLNSSIFRMLALFSCQALTLRSRSQVFLSCIGQPPNGCSHAGSHPGAGIVTAPAVFKIASLFDTLAPHTRLACLLLSRFLQLLPVTLLTSSLFPDFNPRFGPLLPNLTTLPIASSHSNL